MKPTKLLAAACAATVLGFPAWAQEVGQDWQEADAAAETMMTRVYVREVPSYWTPSEVIAHLQELGYTRINDFDVERDHYEVEAMAPNGNEVEIEVSPVTGAILDVEDNWF